jgi:DNA-binding LacI/PurR family transcriptional regulator
VANGLVVLVGNDDRDAKKLEQYLNMMLSQMPAGVVLVGGQLRDPAAVLPVARAVQRLCDQGVPVVAVGRYELDIPHVAVDDAAAARSAVAHLLELGHREIAFVGGSLNSTTVQDRYAGYVSALARAGVPTNDDLVVQTPMTLEGGSAAAQELVDRKAQFTAVFCATDEVAFGMVSGLRSHGLGVPGDVSVVGMNDVPMSAHSDPPLTTIHVPGRALGTSAWHLLVSEWRSDCAKGEGCLPFELVVRESTAPPRRL